MTGDAVVDGSRFKLRLQVTNERRTVESIQTMVRRLRTLAWLD